MRALFTSIFVTACFLIACSIGCRHEPFVDDVVPVSQSDTTTPTQNNWVVSYFMHNDTLMTKHLNGYTFSFKPNSVLEVNTGVNIVTGTWRIIPDVHNQQFILTITGADDMLEMLDEEWEVVINTSAQIQLKHDHTGHQMLVTFEPK